MNEAICGGRNRAAAMLLMALLNPFGGMMVPAFAARGDYLGCYDVGARARVMPLGPSIIRELTVDRCISICLAEGYEFAGLQNGAECFCGDETYNEQGPADESQCNVPCNGEPSQICGGSFRISVYATGFGTTSAPFPRSSGILDDPHGEWRWSTLEAEKYLLC